MHIVIFGAGAMGSLFGGLLAEKGVEVQLFDRDPEHMRIIREKGLLLEEADGGKRRIRIAATHHLEELASADLVILLVKATQTRQSLPQIRGILASDGVVLTLQNGLGNGELISETFGIERTLAGITSHGATQVGLGHIRHAGKGPTYMGAFSPNGEEKLEKVIRVLKGADLEVNRSNDIQAMIWRKLLVNIGINPLTAITRLPNGELAQRPPLVSIMAAAVQEGTTIARSLGISLELEDPLGKVLEVCRATAPNLSSMLQDILAGKVTEIDSINGAVVEWGKKLGIPTPVNATLTNLVRAIEKQ